MRLGCCCRRVLHRCLKELLFGLERAISFAETVLSEVVLCPCTIVNKLIALLEEILLVFGR